MMGDINEDGKINPVLEYYAYVLSQSCPTVCGPMDCSLSVSSVHGIFQARILELSCHSLLQLEYQIYLYFIFFLTSLPWKVKVIDSNENQLYLLSFVSFLQYKTQKSFIETIVAMKVDTPVFIQHN